ncbi:MAG: hypothetical protein XU08_C0001G0189 [candidate division WWE3 bacterium CSP1-7]|uniref:Uncharacterized protein n=1 Tax=candidate division WWE3 bacterium CSP1-7 TaxID=1576480 RepID=A0A0T5ZYA9_UNCKA|nr:MAG: hypothetical protein XU08_C0001G0189 [candidate division WWE3 bacterium CSP1-7]
MIGYYYYLTKIRPYFTQTEKTDYTLIAFSLLTVLVFGFLGIRPLAAAALKAYAQLREGERYENELTEKIIALNQAGNSFFSSAEVSQLGTIIPEGHTQPQIIQALDNDAVSAGFQLKSVVFRPQEKTVSQREINFYVFDFFASGPQKSLVAFIKELEKGQLIQIEFFQTSLRREEGGTSLEVVGRGKAFYLQ